MSKAFMPRVAGHIVMDMHRRTGIKPAILVEYAVRLLEKDIDQHIIATEGGNIFDFHKLEERIMS